MQIDEAFGELHKREDEIEEEHLKKIYEKLAERYHTENLQAIPCTD